MGNNTFNKYELFFWCPDCNSDMDEYGCFGGGSESQGHFNTLNEAIESGWQGVIDTIWKFFIKYEGEIVYEL